MNAEQLKDTIETDPITGEVMDMKDADQLITSLKRLKMRMDILSMWKARFEDAIAALAAHESRTERVAGEKHVAKIEWPGAEFDATVTKKLWEHYPQFREKFLRIEKVGVQRREYDKMLRTTGTEEFEMFKKALMGCEQQSTRRPSIKIED